jgi:PAS domain S-box-containing protein
MSAKGPLNRLFLRYLVAIGTVAAAFLLRLALGRWGVQLPTYITFYPAVMLTALVAGMWPGITATALSALIVDYFLLPPQRTFQISNPSEAIGLALFSAMGVFMCLVAERNRRNRQKTAAYEQELAVQAQEKRYRDLVEFSPLAILVHREQRIDFANPAACRLFAANGPEQLCGKPVLDLFHPDYHALIQERIQSLKEGNRTPLIEEKIVRFDGEVRDVEVVASPVVDEKGPAIQVIVHDISERKQREAQLQRLHRTLKALNNSNQAMLRATGEATLLQQVCKIVTEDCGHAMVWIGFAEEDENKTVRPVAYAGFEDGYLKTLQVTWADTERGRGPTGMAIRTGKPCACRNMLTDPKFAPWKAEAIKRGYACSLVVPLLASGKAFGAITIYSKEQDAFSEDEVRLLTELAGDLAHGINTLRLRADKERADAELRQSREWLSVTLASIGDAVMASDAEGRISFLNPVAEALTGWKTEEAIGQTMQQVFQIINEKTGAPADDIVARVLRERRTFALANHTALVTRDGREIPIEDSAAPIMDAAGNVSGVVLVFHEVTERRRAQNALRQSNAVLKSFNVILEEALHCDTEEALGQTCLREMVQVTESKFGFVGEIGTDGLLHDTAISDIDGFCTMYDSQTGDRRPPGNFKIHGLYGRVLLDGRSLLTNSPAEHPDSIGTPPGHPPLTAFLGVPLIDGGRTIGMIAVGNRSQGYRLEDQAALESLAPAVVEALRRSRAEQALRSNEARLRLALDSANSGTWEWELKTNKNKWSEELWSLYGISPHSCEPSFDTWIESIHPEDREMAETTVREASATGSDLDLEYRVPAEDRTIRWLMARGRCLRDANDNPVRYVGIVMNVTERKRAEATLMQSEKLASVGRVAATIAHEINNPLAAVMNTLYLARTCAEAPALVQHYLEIADDELKRVSLITHQALGFYRESTAPAQVAVAVILDSAMDLLQSRIKSKGAIIAKQYQSGLQLTAVAGELRQVFSNLLANSLDAISEYGTIKMRARAIKSPKDGSRCIRITVADDGSGIARSARSRIFEALFTTKDAIGTGLGLWVSKQIVDKHSGWIHLRSKTEGPRRGTAFSIVLPLQAADCVRKASGMAAGGSE